MIIKMILIRGLPGSGKSTLAKKIQYQMGGIGYAHLEADQFFYDEQGNYNFDPSKLHQAHQRCLYNTRVCLTGNQPVIVSNTFTTKKELKPYFELAREFGIVPTVLLAQNGFGSIHGVPDEKMEQMRKRFQFDISDLFIVECTSTKSYGAGF